MIFYYNTTNGHHSHVFYTLTVYHRDSIALPYICADTPNLSYAIYFLCDEHNCYIDLSAIYSSYDTDPDDARCLYNLKLQYIPESLI